MNERDQEQALTGFRLRQAEQERDEAIKACRLALMDFEDEGKAKKRVPPAALENALREVLGRADARG